jgi:hypothetical protein
MTAKCAFLLFDEHRPFCGVMLIPKFPFLGATMYNVEITAAVNFRPKLCSEVFDMP